MMTIKYKTGLLIILGILMSFSACRDEIIPPDVIIVDGGDLVPIMLDVRDIFGGSGGSGTYSLTDSVNTPGTVSEDYIGDVRVYIFKANGECEEILKEPKDKLPKTALITTGVKNFVAIVNADTTGNVTGLPDPGQESTITYATLLRKISEEKKHAPQSPFLMTGKKTNVYVSKQTEEASKDEARRVSIEVERTVAKVTLLFTKSGQKTKDRDIVITGLTLHRGADRVGLFETPNPNPAVPDIDSVCTVFDSNSPGLSGTVPLKGNSDGYYCRSRDTFYTYENLAHRDTSIATYFEVKAKVDGSNEKSCKIYLAQDESADGSDTVWNVKRNFWYDVHVDIIDPGFDSVKITVISCPWNLAETQDTIVGGTYYVKTATPFKLVKNYTQAECGAHPEFPAIDEHSKGASWIELFVQEGTSWKLEFNGRPENADVIMSVDSGKTWSAADVSGMGDNNAARRIYIYRPYVEGNELESGPSFSLRVGVEEVRDFVVQPRDMTPVPTNCYILRPHLPGVPYNKTYAYIPLKGVYRYWEDYLLENGKSIPTGTVRAELLWQDRPGVIKDNISVLKSGERDSAYLHVEAGEVQGNAVVAMYVDGDNNPSNDTIYWSFHIWVTEYNPYEAAGQKLHRAAMVKNIFMDRNLGALSNKYDAAGEARGLYYQFGRKDPFPRTADWNIGNSIIWYDKSNTLKGAIAFKSVMGGGSQFRPLDMIMSVLNEPMTYYKIGGSSWPLSDEDSCLWNTLGGRKTAFDPCPEGWRVPEQKEAADNTSSPWYGLAFGENVSGYDAGRYVSSVGYYPYSGYLDGTSGSATVANAKTIGYYWTSKSNNKTNGVSLILSGMGVTPIATMSKEHGISVRCVADLHYLKEASGGGLFGNSAEDMSKVLE